jgi:hypothetical protein
VKDEELAYVKLISALKGIAAGKGPHDRIEADGGRSFEILAVLHGAAGLEGDFAGDHVDDVKAALAAWKTEHGRTDIAGVAAGLLKKVPPT